MAERGEWDGRPNKGGRAGNRRDAERAAERKKSQRGEESDVKRDEHGNLVSKTHGQNHIVVLKHKITNTISKGEYPGYELSHGKDKFVNLFKSLISEGGNRERLLHLIQADDSKDQGTLARDRERLDAYNNVTKPDRDRLSFLSGLRFYLNIVLNSGGGGGGGAGVLPHPIPVNNNEKVQADDAASKAAASASGAGAGKVSRAVTAAQEALQNAASGRSSIVFNPIAAFNIQNCVQWDHVVNETRDEDGDFEERFTSGAPLPEIPEREKEARLGMNRNEYTSQLRMSCLARRKGYLFRGAPSGGAAPRIGKGGKEKYLYDTDEYYKNKYLKYKNKYLELKNLLN